MFCQTSQILSVISSVESSVHISALLQQTWGIFESYLVRTCIAKHEKLQYGFTLGWKFIHHKIHSFILGPAWDCLGFAKENCFWRSGSPGPTSWPGLQFFWLTVTVRINFNFIMDTSFKPSYQNWVVGYIPASERLKMTKRLNSL